MATDLTELAKALKRSSNAFLILGAGISVPAGIPGGYRLLMEFGEDHPSVTGRLELRDYWVRAKADLTSAYTHQRAFADALVAVVKTDVAVEEALMKWLMGYRSMAGGTSDDHAILVLLWLQRVFKHLVTTNWDFLLETQIEALYDEAYGDPFQAVEFALSDGTVGLVEADKLFCIDEPDSDEAAWNPRWDIVANETDLPELRRSSRPVWKIHGSPFFLHCPECRGMNRWKRRKDVHVGDPCPEHPGTSLRTEIIFWGDRVDKPYPKVWQRLRQRLARADLILVCGLSGADTYIRDEVQRYPNAWVVNPSEGEWDQARVRFIPQKGGDLTRELRLHFPIA